MDGVISKGITTENFDLFRTLLAKKENPNAIQIYHCIPELFRRQKRKCRAIAICAFENSPGPKNWIDLLNRMDGVIFPSSFCQEAFDLKKPKIVIPHCLDFEKYKYVNREVKKDFRFLFCGTNKKRKGIDTLLTAWKEEKLYENGCSLTLKTGKIDFLGFGDFLGQKQKIETDNKVYKDEELPSFFSSFDCYIGPSFGEGFGLPGLQSLCVGTPIIVSNYSGIKEYANPANSYLLEVEGKLKPTNPMDGYVQFLGCSWPYFSVKQIRERMRHVYEYQEEAIEGSKKAQDELSRNFGYGSASEGFKTFIGQVYDKEKE